MAQDTAPLSPGDFIGKWMSILEPTRVETERHAHESNDEYASRLEKRAVSTSLQNLMTFPCVSILAERGKLQLHGAYFGVAKGSLSILDRATG